MRMAMGISSVVLILWMLASLASIPEAVWAQEPSNPFGPLLCAEPGEGAPSFSFEVSHEERGLRFTPRLESAAIGDGDLVGVVAWEFGDGQSSVEEQAPLHVYAEPGTYTVKMHVVLYRDVETSNFAQGCAYEATAVVNFVGPESCCDNSFALEPGERYVIGAWVKEEVPEVVAYRHPGVDLVFEVEGELRSAAGGGFRPRGAIIDGWQRIEEEFRVPEGATELRIDLLNDGPDEVYFDDIRIFPLDGSMKSFVYDPVTLRLMAELDERNYATLYEYDEEGALSRVEKETARGIFTIQESRSSTRKVSEPREPPQ